MATPPLPAPLPERASFPSDEEATLALWARLDAFKTSLELSRGKPEVTFYDGPPFATGLPHYGHILAGTIKDIVTRYATQTGHYVSRRFGWDCHGLPVEHEIDKKLGISGRDDVMKMGIAAYNAECRAIVTRYCAEWETTITRLGRWIDFKNDYKTMEPCVRSRRFGLRAILRGGGATRGRRSGLRADCARRARCTRAPPQPLPFPPPARSSAALPPPHSSAGGTWSPCGGSSRPSSPRASCTSRSA